MSAEILLSTWSKLDEPGYENTLLFNLILQLKNSNLTEQTIELKYYKVDCMLATQDQLVGLS